jgi:hypothetical protein
MKVQNVRWGLKGTPYGQPCLFFDLDGRPASAFWEQKKGIVDNGCLFIDFEDGNPSHLPELTLRDELGRPFKASNRVVYSPWLNEKMDEMCDADPFEDRRVIGDEPEDGEVEESED